MTPDARIAELAALLEEKETEYRVLEDQALTAIAEVFGVLEAYEKWEADLIMSAEAWAPNGTAETPRIPQELWDRLIEIQTMRNTALASARGEFPL